MKNRIMLTRKKRVDAQPGLFGQLLEASVIQLMRDENITLFFRKFL